MRRQRNSGESSAIRLVNEFLRARNIDIREPIDQAAILDTLTRAVARIPQNEILVHGKRIESMFSYVAGALGHCVAIKEEDAGELYTMNTDIAVPDFRVLTLEGKEYFVEVKNCHKVGTNHRYRIKRDYLAKLRNYANLFDCELKIAIYWSRYSLWSLVAAEAFEFDGVLYSLSMAQCMKRNEMRIIGDCMVGTVPPIILRVVTDPKKPRKISSNGRVEFHIGDIEFHCGGRVIENSFEQKLAWFLFLYGDWTVGEPETKIENGNLIWIQFMADKARVEGQHFSTLGFLSQMTSLQYNELTTEEGEIVRLSPTLDPEKLGILIPADFRGEDLRLWRFTMSPNYE